MIDGYQLKQCSDWYYLMPHPPKSVDDMINRDKSMTLSREMIIDDLTRRESFPQQHHESHQQYDAFQKTHRRAVSCIAFMSPQHHTIASGDHRIQISQPVSPSCNSQTPRQSISHYSSVGSLLSKGEGFSGYDASQSNSVTSLSTVSGAPNVRKCCPVGDGSVERFWLLMQVTEELVKVLFHIRYDFLCLSVYLQIDEFKYDSTILAVYKSSFTITVIECICMKIIRMNKIYLACI